MTDEDRFFNALAVIHAQITEIEGWLTLLSRELPRPADPTGVKEGACRFGCDPARSGSGVIRPTDPRQKIGECGRAKWVKPSILKCTGTR